MSQSDIIVKQHFSTSLERLWTAITDHKQMIGWFFENIPEFKPVKGFMTQFDVDAGERIFRHVWDVIEVEKGKRLTLRWRYAGYAGDSTVTFQVQGDDNSSELVVTTSGIDSFPGDVPEFKPESCRQGWEYFIQERLKEFVGE